MPLSDFLGRKQQAGLASMLPPSLGNPLMNAQVQRAREAQFQTGIRSLPWFAEFVREYGEQPDLNTPDYNYRAAWAAGLRPERYAPDGGRYHWPSSLPSGEMLKGATHQTLWKELFMRQTGVNPDTLPQVDY